MRQTKNQNVFVEQDYALLQQQHQQQQQQQNQQALSEINSSDFSRKSSRKYKKIIAPTIATTKAACKCNYIDNNNIKYNSNTNSNKWLIALLLLITMTTTTTICETATAAAAQLAASASATSAQAASFLSPTLLQQQQQRQQQQQQLFALLTKNRQTSGHQWQQQQQQQHHHHDFAAEDTANDEHLLEEEHNDNINSSIETSGFVADDGQQYEKAEQVLAAAAAAANANSGATTSTSNAATGNAVNCPKECKCLNDFFDCGKRHLDRVPELPSYVQVIDLVGNKLNDSTVLKIANLPELIKLSLKRNQLETIPKFNGLTLLKHLNLANNRIQRISSEALAALPKLKALDLSRNMLHTVEASCFPKTNHLAHLILSYNDIASVSEKTFETLQDLIELDLSGNRLSLLPAGVFQNLTKLKKLSLNYNHLEINWSTFRGLVSLQKLFLKANNIRSLQDGVFHVMRAIETIELDHNGITSLSRQGLFNLTKLHHLSLSNNSISRIELDTWEFTQSLITLDLSHNNISEFKPQHLDCLHRLRHLNLGHNKINYLVDSTFDCVKNLEDLNLRRNKLAWIIEDPGTAPPFKALRKLKKLDLYGNNLKQINTKSLNGLSSLETLNLGGNSLASIQTGAFEHMPHLQKVNFKSLNFICDCELLWFRRWLQRTQATQMSGNAVCGYPDHLLDREVLSLSPTELICADTPKPVITQEPNNQLAVKGANITMQCIAMSPAAASLAAADELKIKWRHDNQQIRERPYGSHHTIVPAAAATETQIHHNQETNQTTIIGLLRLYNVSYESAGKYQCVVTNAFGTTYSQKFKLSIGIHPSFLQIPLNLTIDSGESARLVCSATGDPTPEIALQKFGASDFPAATERRLQVVREENAFIITNAKPIDTGIYTCTAESAAGEIKINASLLVNDKPLPPIPMVHKEIMLSQPSVLECLTPDNDDFAPPYRRREWFKDNKPFHTSATSESERYYFTTAKELLVIVNTQSMDSGHYRCEITDDAKTLTLQTELIVVKDEFSQNIIIIAVVLVTTVCVLIGSFIIWLVLFMQKRKLRFGSISPRHHHAASAHTLTGSRAAALDQTQLSTLNRSYLQQHQVPTLDRQQRPRSMGGAELDMEQRNCLISAAHSPHQRYNENGIGITLEYLSRGDMELLDHHHHHHNQDHLSSKDSGTGSDAAAKRSIDDFTLTLLPADEQQAKLRALETTDALEETEFIESNTLGMSEYVDDDAEVSSGLSSVNGTRSLLQQEPNRTPNQSALNTSASSSSEAEREVEGEETQRRNISPPGRASCKSNLSTNFYTVGNMPYAAVDI